MLAGVAGKAYDYIFNCIVSGEFPLGSPISEADIAATLGISRAPIREAFKILQAESLITYFHGRGTFVMTISQEDVIELFELRIAFEITALRNDYNIIPDYELIKVRKAIEALDDNAMPEQFYAVDSMLHGMIVRYCGNERLIRFYDTINKQFSIVRRISASDPDHFSRSKKWHFKILDAIQNRNLEDAEKLLYNHLRETQNSTFVSQYHNYSRR